MFVCVYVRVFVCVSVRVCKRLNNEIKLCVVPKLFHKRRPVEPYDRNLGIRRGVHSTVTLRLSEMLQVRHRTVSQSTW